MLIRPRWKKHVYPMIITRFIFKIKRIFSFFSFFPFVSTIRNVRCRQPAAAEFGVGQLFGCSGGGSVIREISHRWSFIVFNYPAERCRKVFYPSVAAFYPYHITIALVPLYGRKVIKRWETFLFFAIIWNVSNVKTSPKWPDNDRRTSKTYLRNSASFFIYY